MKDNDDHLCGQQRPTLEQAAWVLSHLNDALREPGTFRHLIYDRMGYSAQAGAYQALLAAGGMNLTNAFSDLEELRANATTETDEDAE